MVKEMRYDKTDWPVGPWHSENDYVAWIDSLTHYPSVIQRLENGAWAGLVGLKSAHSIYLVSKNDTVYDYIDVHGGITFTGFVTNLALSFYPAQRLWWIGFDCMHDNDLMPREMQGTYGLAEYRDEEFAKLECAFLAQQLQLME